jgi:hypothetical protein
MSSELFEAWAFIIEISMTNHINLYTRKQRDRKGVFYLRICFIAGIYLY